MHQFSKDILYCIFINFERFDILRDLRLVNKLFNRVAKSVILKKRELKIQRIKDKACKWNLIHTEPERINKKDFICRWSAKLKKIKKNKAILM